MHKFHQPAKMLLFALKARWLRCGSTLTIDKLVRTLIKTRKSGEEVCEWTSQDRPHVSMPTAEEALRGQRMGWPRDPVDISQPLSPLTLMLP